MSAGHEESQCSARTSQRHAAHRRRRLHITTSQFVLIPSMSIKLQTGNKQIKPAYKHFHSFKFSFYCVDLYCKKNCISYIVCEKIRCLCDEASDLKIVKFTSHHRLQRHCKSRNDTVSGSNPTRLNNIKNKQQTLLTSLHCPSLNLRCLPGLSQTRSGKRCPGYLGDPPESLIRLLCLCVCVF